MSNPVLKRNILTSNAGPLRVTGLKPAVLSLQQVMQDVQKSQPEVYAALSHRGMLVVRYQRGSTTKISNHGWGCAIDLAINGVLDARGDNMVQYGLTLIAPIFNRFGWYWGAAFDVEDGMHFEAGTALTQAWRRTLI
jgi:hypothetical protein